MPAEPGRYDIRADGQKNTTHQDLYSGLIRLHILHHASESEFCSTRSRSSHKVEKAAENSVVAESIPPAKIRVKTDES